MEKPKITIIKNGPIVVDGLITIAHDGLVGETTKAFLCRCGKSKKKPYCDGSHKGMEFE